MNPVEAGFNEFYRVLPSFPMFYQIVPRPIRAIKKNKTKTKQKKSAPLIGPFTSTPDGARWPIQLGKKNNSEIDGKFGRPVFFFPSFIYWIFFILFFIFGVASGQRMAATMGPGSGRSGRMSSWDAGAARTTIFFRFFFFFSVFSSSFSFFFHRKRNRFPPKCNQISVPSFTEFYRVSCHFTVFYRVLPSFT